MVYLAVRPLLPRAPFERGLDARKPSGEISDLREELLLGEIDLDGVGVQRAGEPPGDAGAPCVHGRYASDGSWKSPPHSDHAPAASRWAESAATT